MLKVGNHEKILMLCTLLAAGSWEMTTIASPEPHAAEQTARKFYAWALAHNGISLPSPEELKALQPMLTPQLLQLFEQSHAVEAYCIKLTPEGDKPPVFEGSLLVGNYEGAREVVVGAPEVQGSRAEISSRLFEVDERFPVAHPYRVYTWVDKLELINEGGQWRIADIVFTEEESLVAILTGYIAENQSCSQ